MTKQFVTRHPIEAIELTAEHFAGRETLPKWADRIVAFWGDGDQKIAVSAGKQWFPGDWVIRGQEGIGSCTSFFISREDMDEKFIDVDEAKRIRQLELDKWYEDGERELLLPL